MKDENAAAEWYRRAAERGSVEAQVSLGVLYAEGRGVVQDEAEAVRWYRMATEQGDVAAQVNLGAMYAAGRGVVRDREVAMSCLLYTSPSPRDLSTSRMPSSA